MLTGEAKRQYQKEYMKKKRASKSKYPTYNKTIYCIDIETSTDKGINAAGEEVDVSFIISFAVSTLNIETGEINHDYFGRTYNDLNDYLYNLQAKSGKLKTLIYCHFFAYEWSHFKDNVKFFKDNITKQLFIKNNKPLIIQCDNLSFRCSYLLINKSVETIGNELSKRLNEDWHKLEYEYSKKRTPLDKLSKEEIEYNFRDCDIVLKYLLEVILKKYSIKKLYDKVFTVTGQTRIDNEDNNDKYSKRAWIIFNNLCRPPTFKEYLMQEASFMGGFVSSNPLYCGKIVDNAISYDISSSYPYIMYCLKFPYDFREAKILKDVEEFESYRDLQFYNIKKFFIGKFKIENMKLKKDINYPLWSKHKLFNAVEVIDINGKILKADSGTLIVTSVDYENIKKFYDFNLVEIEDIYINHQCRKLPKYVLNNLERLLKSKSDLKKPNNLIEDAAELKHDYKFPEGWEWLEKIINDADTLDSQQVLMKSYYMGEKSALNAQYGICVQRPISSNIEYDFNKRKYTEEFPDYEEFLKKKATKTNMIVGTFVTAFARNQLIRMLYTLIINGITVYYTDTDSIKCDNSKPEFVEKLFNDFNAGIEINAYKIGLFNKEIVYKKFCSNGNKSYIVLYDDMDKEGNLKEKVKATISGMPHASKIYNKLYEENFNKDFDVLIKEAFAFNITVNPSVTDKLTSIYERNILELDGDEELKPGRIHININRYDDYVYTGLILAPVPLTIRGIDISKDQFKNAVNLAAYFNLDINKLIFKYTLDMVEEEITIKKEKVSSKVLDLLKEGIEKIWQEQKAVKEQ